MKIDFAYYTRDFNLDFKNLNWDHPAVQQSIRVGKVALPFLCLHGSLGRPLSLTMGVVRVVSDLRGLYEGKGNRAVQVCQVALSVASVAGAIFQHRFSIIFATVGEIAELVASLKSTDKVADTVLQLLNSTIYLALMFVSGPEMMLVSLLLQSSLQFFRAVIECRDKGLTLEAAGNFAMGFVRNIQAAQVAGFLIQRYRVCSDPKFNDLKDALKDGDTAFLEDHPLNDLMEYIEKNGVKIELKEGEEIDLGAHLSMYGKEAVKGMNLTLRMREGNQIEVLFKLNHVYRDKLEPYYVSIMKLDPREVSEFLFYSGYESTFLKVDKVATSYIYKGEGNSNDVFGDDYRVALQGVGEVRVGATPMVVSLYDRVVVHLEPGKDVRDLHHLFSVAGLNTVLKPSSADDIERMKIGQLFRVYHPGEAFMLERSESFFKMSIDELKKSIVGKVPEMETRFKDQLPAMKPFEILPGRVRYAVTGLAKEAYDLGARGVIVGVGSWGAGEKDSFERAAKMIKAGAISTQIRQEASIPINGLGPEFDEVVGSSDSIFTRLVTESAYGTPFSEISFTGHVQLLFSLDEIETGTYQYPTDSSGTRFTPDKLPKEWLDFWDQESLDQFFPYTKRADILTFTKNQQEKWYNDNEMMIKDRVPPKMITGCVVQSEKHKEELIHVFETYGLVKDSTILGRSVNEFIHVSDHLNADMFTQSSEKHSV